LSESGVGVKGSSNLLVAGFPRSFPQESWSPSDSEDCSAVHTHSEQGGTGKEFRLFDPEPCSVGVCLWVRGLTAQHLSVDEQCRSGTPLGRPPSQPILKLQMWMAEPDQPAAGISWDAPEVVPEVYPGDRCKVFSQAWSRHPHSCGRSGVSCVRELSKAKSSLGFLRAFTGKQYRRCGVLRERAWDV